MALGGSIGMTSCHAPDLAKQLGKLQGAVRESDAQNDSDSQ
jgi:hypothetical protein